MMPEIDRLTPPRAHRIAAAALGGLLSGITACSGAQNEVVVDPTASANTVGAQESAPTADTSTDTETTEDPAPRRRRRARKPPVQVVERQGLPNCCMGKNECKGKGGCKTDKHECMGLNDCKGLGGCKTGIC